MTLTKSFILISFIYLVDVYIIFNIRWLAIASGVMWGGFLLWNLYLLENDVLVFKKVKKK